MNSGDLLQEGQKEIERNHGISIEIDLILQKEISMSNPTNAICVAKHSALYGKPGGKKVFFQAFIS